MKIVEKLTKRLDHMVPDTKTRRVSKKDISAFLKALALEEQRIEKK